MGDPDAASPRTVLVADDEASLLKLLTRVLERAGYCVVPAADGGEALRAVAAQPRLCAAVVDATLRPEGSQPLLEALASVPGPPAVVVTSGEALPPEARQALERGGGRFLAKPFRPADLLEALEELASGAADGTRT